MYLLNNYQISKHVEDANSNYLDIDNYEKDNLQHTSYYFRLGLSYTTFDEEGNKVQMEAPRKKPIIKIKPHEYIIVESIEVFTLSDKVKGTIGSLSDMINKGLQINYSPFIDPLYKGWLSVGIKNLLNKEIDLICGDNIGKVSFYDISDTYPIKIIKGSKQDDLFSKRALADGPHYPEVEDDSELYKPKSWSKK
jgi:deoxycytidine triphosphate deaminase